MAIRYHPPSRRRLRRSGCGGGRQTRRRRRRTERRPGWRCLTAAIPMENPYNSCKLTWQL